MRLSGCLPAQIPGRWWLIFKRKLWGQSQVVSMTTLTLVPAMHNRINEINADDSGT